MNINAGSLWKAIEFSSEFARESAKSVETDSQVNFLRAWVSRNPTYK